MAIFDFFLSRNNAASTPANYVGHVGRLFYNSEDGVVKLSDGVTPGGLPIPYTIATDTIVGGIKEGPGVTIDSEGRIFIDSAGLSFTFGDLAGTVGTYAAGHPKVGIDYAKLSSINLNEDIVIASNNDGVVKVIGDFSVYATDGIFDGNIDDSLAYDPVFRVKGTGQIQMLVPLADEIAGGVEIVGNTTGDAHPPNQTGVILHVTGKTGLVSRNYFDANDNYALIVGRRFNGLSTATTKVLAGQSIFRIAAQASTDSDFQPFGPSRIDFRATEDQAPGAQGGEIGFYVTPLGSSGLAGIEVLKLNAETGVTTRNINPVTDETYDLGSPTLRWRNVYIGRASLFMADQVTNDPVEITVNNGTLLMDGVQNLRVGSMTIVGNTLTTTSTSLDIVLGEAGDTGVIDASNRELVASDLTVSGNSTFNTFTGKHNLNVRAAGTIADGGTLTINFATDAIVHCVWGNGMTIAYTNFTPGSIVKLLASKTAGTGVDTLDFGGLTPGLTSEGVITVGVTGGITEFVDFTCIGTTIGSVYAKIQ